MGQATPLDANFREELIRRLDESRQAIEMALGQLAPDVEIYPGWRKKEMVAHLTGWEDAVVEGLTAHLASHPPLVPLLYRGVDYFNEQSLAERTDLTYEQGLQEWTLARQQFKELLLAATDEKLAQPFILAWGDTLAIADVVNRVLLPHEREHLRGVQACQGFAADS